MSDQETSSQESAQDPDGTDRLGLCLRACFEAENHATLGDDVIRLLLHLSREPATPARDEPNHSSPGQRGRRADKGRR
jgi:hypothetical protein